MQAATTDPSSLHSYIRPSAGRVGSTAPLLTLSGLSRALSSSSSFATSTVAPLPGPSSSSSSSAARPLPLPPPLSHSLLPISARTSLCEQIESLCLLVAKETAAGRDPAFAIGLSSPLFSPPFFQGARDLAGALKVLRVVYEAALEGKTVTQRGLYYRAASFFRTQQEAQAALTRVSSLLSLEKHEMGIVAASRGKVAGLLSIRSPMSPVSSGAGGTGAGRGWLDLSAPGAGPLSIPGGWAISPPSASNGCVENRGAEVILVVEKDSVFSRLCEDRVWERLSKVVQRRRGKGKKQKKEGAMAGAGAGAGTGAGAASSSDLGEESEELAFPCILVTGCGVPDLATRSFVSSLSTSLVSPTTGQPLPVLCLVDSNPFGLAIMLCYLKGSKQDGGRYAVPNLGWLGLCKEDCERYDMPLGALQALSPADEKKALSLLADPFIARAVALAEKQAERADDDDDGDGDGERGETPDPLALAVADECRLFLETREKAEIEGLGQGMGLEFLSDTFLPDKWRRRDWVSGDGAQ